MATTARSAPKYGSAVADDLIEGMQSLLADLRAGKLNIRNVYLTVPIPEMKGPEVRTVRESLGLSQPLFAVFIGASTSAVRAWERDAKVPTPMARRFLDLIRTDPAYWQLKVSDAASPASKHGEVPAATEPPYLVLTAKSSAKVGSKKPYGLGKSREIGKGASPYSGGKIAGTGKATPAKKKSTCPSA